MWSENRYIHSNTFWLKVLLSETDSNKASTMIVLYLNDGNNTVVQAGFIRVMIYDYSIRVSLSHFHLDASIDH